MREAIIYAPALIKDHFGDIRITSNHYTSLIEAKEDWEYGWENGKQTEVWTQGAKVLKWPANVFLTVYVDPDDVPND